MEVTVEKMLGIVLIEIIVNQVKGVYCAKCSEDSAVFAVGVCEGDMITSLNRPFQKLWIKWETLIHLFACFLNNTVPQNQ